MHVHAARVDTGKRPGKAIERERLGEGNAELVLGLSGGDLVMGLGVDIGVDAKRDAGGEPERSRDLAQAPKLRLRFDIEGEDAVLKRARHLLLGLAHAGEGDLLRDHADGEHATKLPLRHDVHAGAEAGKRGEHAEIGIRLDRVADLRVKAFEGFAEDAVMPFERRRRIAIEGGADAAGEFGKVDVLGVEDPLPVGKVMHGRLMKPYCSKRSIHSDRAGACDILVEGSALVSGYEGFGRSSEPRLPQALKPTDRINAIARRTRKALPMVVPL